MKRVEPLVVSNLPSQEQLLMYPLRQLRKHIQTVRYRKWKGGPHVACQVSDRENSGRTEVETPVDKSIDLEILNFLLDCFYKFFFLQEFGVCLITQLLSCPPRAYRCVRVCFLPSPLFTSFKQQGNKKEGFLLKSSHIYAPSSMSTWHCAGICV